MYILLIFWMLIIILYILDNSKHLRSHILPDNSSRTTPPVTSPVRNAAGRRDAVRWSRAKTVLVFTSLAEADLKIFASPGAGPVYKRAPGAPRISRLGGATHTSSVRLMT